MCTPSSSKGKSLVAVMSEVDPFAMVNLSGKIGKRLFDSRNGVVGGTRVDDDPSRKKRFDRSKAPFNDGGLVADDHHQDEFR